MWGPSWDVGLKKCYFSKVFPFWFKQNWWGFDIGKKDWIWRNMLIFEMSFIHINIVASKKSINIFNCTIEFHRIEFCYFQDCSDVQIWTWTDLLIPPNPLLKDAFFRRCSLVSKMTGDSLQNWWSIIEFPWKFNIDTQKVAILERRYLKKSIVLVSIHRLNFGQTVWTISKPTIGIFRGHLVRTCRKFPLTRTGDSLQYAFIIYENPRDCEQARKKWPDFGW